MSNTTNKSANVNKSANNVNANNSLQKIFANLQEQTKGLLKTSLGTKKQTLYKESLFADTTDKQKKSLRKKIRNVILSLANSIVSETDKTKLKKLCTSFNEFYKATYQTNDYTLQSVCNENLEKSKKDMLAKMLDIVKKNI